MLSLILSALISMQTVQQEVPQHRVEKVRDNIYCVFGPGGNVGVIVDNDCVVMIDCQFERSLPGLLEAVRTVSDKPIKYLINTHHHGDHVGANPALAAQVRGIIAHTNTRTRMLKEQASREPDMRGGLPDILVGEADTKKPGIMTIVLGSFDVHIAHFGPAHTDNDVAVGIPSARVIHIGDMLFLERLPFIDVDSGGSFNGLVQVIGHVLSWLPDDTLVIPGHGPLCDKKELARHHSFLLAVQQHVRRNPKMSPKELADSFDKKPWEDKKPSPQFVTWETLFQAASGKGSGRV